MNAVRFRLSRFIYELESAFRAFSSSSKETLARRRRVCREPLADQRVIKVQPDIQFYHYQPT